MVATAHTRVIPLAVPAGFIFLGEAFLLWGAWLWVLHPEAFLVPRHPVGLAGAHLYLLGFGVGVLLGAMHQLLPVVLEAPLYRPGLGYPVMALWALGVALLALGFAWLPVLVPLGGGLALCALLLFAYHAYRTFRLAPRWNRVATALAWVVFYLVLTPLLGLVQALALRFGFYDPERLAWHLLAGLGGVFLLSILGVGYKLLSMFTLTHGVDEGVLGLLLWVANLGLGGLTLGERLGYVLLLLAYGLALYDTYRILRHRAKRNLDIGVRHYLAGLGFLGLALMALPARPLWAVWWFALGFVGLVVSGMLYKILPFLVWTHRYAPRAGKERVPLLKDMLPEGLGYLAGGLWGLGALAFPLFPWAGWALALGAAVHAFALWEVMRR
ncbi:MULTISPECIES: hypothetical protein [Thermus]|jgi:hypothetical protein|uniref:NnrS family protein n=1 Tax=Thermus brockianus TaxID=56956 RepID=A0A1J0LT51_THEBO|nr:hypothetical protein [Thermus brockianus]APD08615.1 hypothetical protein A0O31_00405 [Thermus brockianus]